MANNPLNDALSGLGATIQTINDKVESGKQRVKAYKQDIVQKLKEVIERLKELEANSKLKIDPGLKENLEKTRDELNQKNIELQASNLKLTELQNQLDSINSELANKNQQLSELESSNQSKDGTIQQLNDEKAALTQQKADIEKQFNDAQTEVNSLIGRIADINNTLVKQIELIDTIAGELDDNTEVANGFKAIADNIQAIMNMINNPNPRDTFIPPPLLGNTKTGTQPNNNFPLYNKFMDLTPQGKNNILGLITNTADNEFIKSILPNEGFDSDDDKQKMEDILKNHKNALDKEYEITDKGFTGGKRKRKTRKRSHKKTKKTKKGLKGGYVYSSSKELDKASSVISDSSYSKSRSISRSKSAPSFGQTTQSNKKRLSKKHRFRN